MPQKKRPLLSIGLIVKDEIRCIERCLKSLQPLRNAIACEIVVADTGSSDGTREIAMEYADVFFDFHWVNDFAAARNAVMDRCTGIWYMTLDADEWLAEDIQPLLDFLQGPDGKKYNYAYLCMCNYLSDDWERTTDFLAGRLVKMRTGIRYVGAIHEALFQGEETAKVVEPVLLYHDGYTPAVFSCPGRDKSKRNLPLIQEALEKDPLNLMRILQCIESSDTEQHRLQYIQRGIKTSKQPGIAGLIVAPAIYRHGIAVAVQNRKLHTLAHQWLEEAEERFPDSIFIRLDAQGYALMLLYQEKQYEAAAKAGRTWEKALADYDAGGKNRAELIVGTLQLLSHDFRSLLRCMLFGSLCELGEWDEASDTLERIEFQYVIAGNYPPLVQMLFDHGGQLRNVAVHLQRLWDTTNKLALEKKSGWPENKKFLMSALNRQFSKVALGKTLGIHGIIAELKNCEPGRCARIICSDDPEEIAHLLSEVECWDDILLAVIPHVMAMGVALPSSLLQQGKEWLEDLAAALPEYSGSVTQLVLDYSAMYLSDSNLLQMNWILDLCIVAIRLEQWEQTQVCEVLCDLFNRLMELYFTLFYGPDLQREENLSVLPGIHRFGWYCLQAKRALKAECEAEYLRLLRDGLKVAPVMKGMVDFLSKQLEIHVARKKAAANPELRSLAEQVRKLLSAYPAGDPAVAVLKQSAVYQKVAYLIDCAT